MFLLVKNSKALHGEVLCYDVPLGFIIEHFTYLSQFSGDGSSTFFGCS
jgi:hypothetical protein